MKDANFRVIPGLSIKPEEIGKRLKNRSLSIGTDGLQYSLEKEIAGLNHLNHTDMARSMLHDRARKEQLELELRDVKMKSKAEIDAKIKADLKELEERRAKEGKKDE